MAHFRVGELPDDPLAASAAFFAEILPQVLQILPLGGGDPRSGGGAQAGVPDLAGQHRQDHSPVPLPHAAHGSPPRSGEDCLTLVFAPADHPHRDWRKAAIATLARERAPARINGIASADEDAIAAALAYLEGAGGITGQYLPLDSAGAGSVVG